MAVYDVLPDFDTSRLDASRNGQELCNELKRLYDHLMTAVVAQSFRWDLIDYTYRSDGRIGRVDFIKGSMRVGKIYTYAGDKLVAKRVLIYNVPPRLGSWQFVFRQEYSYDSNGRLISSLTNTNQ